MFPDSECESSATASYSGGGERGCTVLTASRRGFEIADFGSCVLELYSDTGCSNSENQYDAIDEDECIPPDYIWGSFDVFGC